MTSTMIALSLVNSFHHVDSQLGIPILLPATVGVDTDAVRAATAAPSALGSDDPSRCCRQLSGFDDKRLTGTRGTGGLDSSVQPFLSSLDSIYTRDNHNLHALERTSPDIIIMKAARRISERLHVLPLCLII